MGPWDRFATIWVIDFEFSAARGHRPTPICLVAHEITTGVTHHLWPGALARGARPPFGGPRDLVVCYFATAEMSCYLALGWPLPAHLIDLYVEVRALTNDGERRDRSLLGAGATFGLSTIGAAEKSDMRQLAMRGGPFTAAEAQALVAYCESDVRVTAALFARLQPMLDVPRALWRGRSMLGFAYCEHIGVPIDVPRLHHLQSRWEDIQHTLVADVDRDYHVFDGLTFKADRFDRYLATHHIPWPRLDSGALDLKDATFRDRSKAFPQLHPLRELRSSLADLRLGELAVGPDHRNRVILSPFGSKTSRCTPSTTASVFGPSVWIRSFIRPEPGTALAYIDYCQQELGIAAALSRDVALIASYESGDPYLSFAIMCGAAPADATPDSHRHLRDQFKVCSLGTLYGIGPESLALRIGQPTPYGAQLLRQHRQTYPQFWRWSEATVAYATAHGRVWSRYGWPLRVTSDTRPRTLANFPMQSNGSEMLRIALLSLTEAGIRVCMPVHDAVLVEAPLTDLEDTVATAQRLMALASAHVLDGFSLRTSATAIRFPDRYVDPRGQAMWSTLTRLLPALQEDSDACPNPDPARYP